MTNYFLLLAQTHLEKRLIFYMYFSLKLHTWNVYSHLHDVMSIQVSEVWRGYELELINYQNKCRLIKGWDDLFTKVKEHINSVTAMKLSPYYKQFEEEALGMVSLGAGGAWNDELSLTVPLKLLKFWIDCRVVTLSWFILRLIIQLIVFLVYSYELAVQSQRFIFNYFF